MQRFIPKRMVLAPTIPFSHRGKVLHLPREKLLEIFELLLVGIPEQDATVFRLYHGMDGSMHSLSEIARALNTTFFSAEAKLQKVYLELRTPVRVRILDDALKDPASPLKFEGFDRPITYLHLPHRIITSLGQHGIFSISDLVSVCTSSGLRKKMRNIGTKGVVLIRSALLAEGALPQ